MTLASSPPTTFTCPSCSNVNWIADGSIHCSQCGASLHTAPDHTFQDLVTVELSRIRELFAGFHEGRVIVILEELVRLHEGYDIIILNQLVRIAAMAQKVAEDLELMTGGEK